MNRCFRDLCTRSNEAQGDVAVDCAPELAMHPDLYRRR